MNIHERINQINNDIENKKNLERAEYQRIYAGLVQRTDELELKNLFEEIKTDLWGMGDIKVREDTNFDTDTIHSISLSAEWPQYKMEHWDSESNSEEYDSGRDVHTVEIIQPLIDYQLYLSKENKTIIELTRATKYSPEDGFYRIVLERDITKSDFKYPTQTDKDKIHNLILSTCAEQVSLKLYPYTQLAEIDRKEIIKRLNFGVIKTYNIPPNSYFYYR